MNAIKLLVLLCLLISLTTSFSMANDDTNDVLGETSSDEIDLTNGENDPVATRIISIQEGAGRESRNIMEVALDSMTVHYGDQEDHDCSNNEENTFEDEDISDEEERAIFVLDWPTDEIPQNIRITQATFYVFFDDENDPGYVDFYVTGSENDASCDSCMDWGEAFDNNDCDINGNHRYIDEFATDDNEWVTMDVTNELRYAYENNMFFAIYTRPDSSSSPGGDVDQDFSGEDSSNRYPYISIEYYEVQCTGGPCCDANGFFRPSNYVCGTSSYTYQCPWGEGQSNPGFDVGVQHINQYCSGVNEQCSGSTSWTPWTVYDDCSSNEYCVESSSTWATCQSCGQHTNQQCFNNDLFWFDNCQNREELVQDCGEDSIGDWGEPYCQDNVTLVHDRTGYDRGCANSACFVEEYNSNGIVEVCDYGCEEGACFEPECFEDNDCGFGVCIDYVCEVDFPFNPTFQVDTSEVWSYEEFFQTHEIISNFSNEIESYLGSCNPQEDVFCWVPFTFTSDLAGVMQVSNLTIGVNPPACYENTDCGFSTSTLPYCNEHQNLVSDFQGFTCEQAGTLEARCVARNATQLVEDCETGCYDGECRNVACAVDSDCGLPEDKALSCAGNAVVLEREQITCLDANTPQARCSSLSYAHIVELCEESQSCEQGSCQDVTCFTDTDCGESFALENYCQEEKAVQEKISWDCVNEGTAESSCVSFSDRKEDTCALGCSDGECEGIACFDDRDCQTPFIAEQTCIENDVLSSVSYEICENPGTLQATCLPRETQLLTDSCEQGEGYCAQGACEEYACLDDTDCSGILFSENYCQGNNLFGHTVSGSCISGGTPEAFCEEEIDQVVLVEECPEICSVNRCVEYNDLEVSLISSTRNSPTVRSNNIELASFKIENIGFHPMQNITYELRVNKNVIKTGNVETLAVDDSFVIAEHLAIKEEGRHQVSLQVRSDQFETDMNNNQESFILIVDNGDVDYAKEDGNPKKSPYNVSLNNELVGVENTRS
ncbi:MAG: hypothetical protein H6502_04260 [Candidatus Woesearchaeota archaeon]|nr:MAG: hypothetical protein H6502_04260 [Candidatus Woesearchaeota archaeon]